MTDAEWAGFEIMQGRKDTMDEMRGGEHGIAAIPHPSIHQLTQTRTMAEIFTTLPIGLNCSKLPVLQSQLAKKKAMPTLQSPPLKGKRKKHIYVAFTTTTTTSSCNLYETQESKNKKNEGGEEKKSNAF